MNIEDAKKWCETVDATHAPSIANLAKCFLALLKKCEDMREALCFYGDLKSWGNEDDSNFKFMIVDDYEDKRPNKKHELFGGKRAREVLEKWKKEKV